MNDEHGNAPIHSGIHTDARPSDPSDDCRTEPAASPQKGRGGAPRGNVNGAKDPDFSRAMRTLREQAAAGRSATSRKALAASQKITKELGAGDAALGDRVARRLADRELLLDLCRGRIKRAAALRTGEPSPWVAMFSKALDDDLSDLRALLTRYLDSTQAKAARLFPTGPVVIVGDREYLGGENCPTCSQPIPSLLVVVTEAPMITLDAIHAQAPMEDVDAPPDFAEPQHRVLEQSAAPAPVQSNAPASAPEPARRLAPGVTLTPGPRRSIDDVLRDAGLGPRRPTGGGPTW